MAKRCMTHQGRGVQKRTLRSLGAGWYEVLEVGHFGRVISRVVARGYEQALVVFSFAAGEVVGDHRK